MIIHKVFTVAEAIKLAERAQYFKLVRVALTEHRTLWDAVEAAI